MSFMAMIVSAMAGAAFLAPVLILKSFTIIKQFVSGMMSLVLVMELQMRFFACGVTILTGTPLCAPFIIGEPLCGLTCPDDIEVENDEGECGAFVNVPSPDADADCIGDVTNDFNGTGDASDFYPVGTTEVTFTGLDQDGCQLLVLLL